VRGVKIRALGALVTAAGSHDRLAAPLKLSASAADTTASLEAGSTEEASD